jgi:hypothetical protein
MQSSHDSLPRSKEAGPLTIQLRKIPTYRRKTPLPPAPSSSDKGLATASARCRRHNEITTQRQSLEPTFISLGGGGDEPVLPLVWNRAGWRYGNTLRLAFGRRSVRISFRASEVFFHIVSNSCRLCTVQILTGSSNKLHKNIYFVQ